MHKKIILALAIMTSSISGYAQMGMDESTSENKTVGEYPVPKMNEMSEKKWSAGVASGVNSPHGPATSSAEYGLIVGFQPIANMSAGIEGNTTHLDNSNDIRQTNVLLRSTYVIGGDIPVIRSTFMGVGLGPVFVSKKVRWAGTPIVGFDIPLSSRSHDYLSLGLEAKYLFITNTDVPDLFASALALKYWF